MSFEEWSSKYLPTKSSDLIINKSHYRTIKNKFNTDSCLSLIIKGRNGVGKTLLIDILIKELNYEVIRIDNNFIKNVIRKNKKEIFDHLSKNMFYMLNSDK